MQKDNWIFLGEGNYNQAYKSRDSREVLKIQKRAVDATDTPERSVRLWNVINSHVPPPARLLNDRELGSGWVCPFIEGVQASDKEMANALLDIFNKTGRIVVDATAQKNFVRTPTGQVLCVDVGMALQFEQRENRSLVRRKSVVSLDTWRNLSAAYEPFLRQCANTNPETVNIVKALVFIKNNRPDIYDASFLKTNPDLINKLASAFDKQNVNVALERLDRANTAIFAIPQDKVQLEVENFVKFLRATVSPFAIADDKVQDIKLSAKYDNPRDGNKPYVNIEISNSSVTALFKQYVTEQTCLAAERYYTSKIETIERIRATAMQDVNLSQSEKNFMTRSCNKLIDTMKQGIEDLKSDPSPQTKHREIESNIGTQLNAIATESQKIARTSGLRGFINNIFETLGCEKPFTITHSATIEAVKDMKSQLTTIKDGDVKSLPQAHDIGPKGM